MVTPAHFFPHGGPWSATRENLTKTLVKNENPKFSYRNNENYQIHLRLFSNKRLELVYTKYEVNRSIIKGDGCIQPFNRVFDMLTGGFAPDFLLRSSNFLLSQRHTHTHTNIEWGKATAAKVELGNK